MRHHHAARHAKGCKCVDVNAARVAYPLAWPGLVGLLRSVVKCVFRVQSMSESSLSRKGVLSAAWHSCVLFDFESKAAHTSPTPVRAQDFWIQGEHLRHPTPRASHRALHLLAQ